MPSDEKLDVLEITLALAVNMRVNKLKIAARDSALAERRNTATSRRCQTNQTRFVITG